MNKSSGATRQERQQDGLVTTIAAAVLPPTSSSGQGESLRVGAASDTSIQGYDAAATGKLHDAIKRLRSLEIKGYYVNTFLKAIEEGANLNFIIDNKSINSMTPLLAIANMNAPDMEGITLEQHLQMVNALLNNDTCKKTTTDSQGNTVLHMAARQGHEHLIVPCLVHIDANAKNNSNLSPLFYAMWNNYPKVEHILKECEATLTDIEQAIIATKEFKNGENDEGLISPPGVPGGSSLRGGRHHQSLPMAAPLLYQRVSSSNDESSCSEPLYPVLE